MLLWLLNNNICCHAAHILMANILGVSYICHDYAIDFILILHIITAL